MEHDPRASMTDWLQRFLSLFRAETEEVNGMPGVKISNLVLSQPNCWQDRDGEA